MTLLSIAKTLFPKVETLIEYAKCGMGLCQLYKLDVDNPADLYFPKEIDLGNGINNSCLVSMKANLYIRSIKGNLTSFGKSGGQNQCQHMGNLETIELPKCTTFYLPYGFLGCEKLHTVKLPALTSITSIATFDSCDKLKHLELGALHTMGNEVLKRCTGLEKVVVGKGTTASLYLYYSVDLTQECLHNIIDNYADMTGKTAPVFHIGGNNLARISPEYIEKMNKKNIEYK